MPRGGCCSLPQSLQILTVPWDGLEFMNAVYHSNAHLLFDLRRLHFDIKFTRQCFENACSHREACRAIQHAFSKPSLENLISKDANLVFYLSVYKMILY